MPDGSPLLRLYSRVAYALPRLLAIYRPLLVFVVLENRPVAQVGQRCSDRFCGFSLVRAKDGANTTVCQFPLGIPELVKAGNVEPLVNRTPSIPFLFLLRSPTISPEIVPSSHIRVQKILLADYAVLWWAADDRTSGHRQAEARVGSKREVPLS